ncbi:MAG: DUF932 domain-containing protein [Planctomycetaceae bacterium]
MRRHHGDDDQAENRFEGLEPRITRLGRLRLITPPGSETPPAQPPRGPVLPASALIDIDGEPCRISPRFWRSMFQRYRFAASTFRYFTPGEVFERIRDRAGDDDLRVLLERRGGGPPVALGVSRHTVALPTLDDIRDLAKTHQGSRVVYSDGIASCSFVPRSGVQPQAIGADAFANRFTLDVPMDGFGHARIHVGLMRLVCVNGLIALHSAFTSDLPASRDPRHTIARAVECYDHADGFAALRSRFFAAQASWASVREAHGLRRHLLRTVFSGAAVKTAALERLDRLTGRIEEHYGVTNLDTLPPRRQRLLPVKCRVYDLLNLASEIATHHATAATGRFVQAWIGATIAEEFDLEGTAPEGAEFADLFLERSPTNSAAAGAG